MKFMKLGSKPDLFRTKGNGARLAATELPADIVVHVGDVKFYLHKFPLLSKSACLQKLLANANEQATDEIHIPDIPGGPSAFEACAKFSYGMTITLNCHNIVAARCAAEYLEMHETIEKGNLIYKIDIFLKTGIFRSWKDSIIVLETTTSLLPWSEDLNIVTHCIDSIALKATVDTSAVEWSYTYNRKKQPFENGLDPHWNGVKKQLPVPKDWWIEDLCELEMGFYKRIISAIKGKGVFNDKVIGESLKGYAYRRLPVFIEGFTVLGNDVNESHSLLETIVGLLPSEKGSVSCSFLLKLLRAGRLLECVTVEKELKRRIGHQLEEASLSDILIPSLEEGNTSFDADIVIDILDEFTMQDSSSGCPQVTEDIQEVGNSTLATNGRKQAVGKLVDEYLKEIAKDLKLPLSKFIRLAERVLSDYRSVHDGLYHAIDMYLKEHTELSKSEKKTICGLIDCRKLSVEACTHAVKNDRLPLRLIVQILFLEQMKVYTTCIADGTQPHSQDFGSSRLANTSNAEDNWDAVPTMEDIKSLETPRPIGYRGSEHSSSGSSDINKNVEKAMGRSNGILMPKKVLGKLWSSKAQGGEKSGIETSDSPGSTNLYESKSTPSRNVRHSVS